LIRSRAARARAFGLLLGLWIFRVGAEQDVASPDLLGRPHRLDLLVVDLAQGLVAGRCPGVLLQHRGHQKFIAQKRLPLLELVGVVEVASLRRARGQDNVGDIGNELLAPLLGRQLLQIDAEVILSHRQLTFSDIDSVDPGHHRVGCRSAGRRG
jgi:hypothetical protein